MNNESKKNQFFPAKIPKLILFYPNFIVHKTQQENRRICQRSGYGTTPHTVVTSRTVHLHVLPILSTRPFSKQNILKIYLASTFFFPTIPDF